MTTTLPVFARRAATGCAEPPSLGSGAAGVGSTVTAPVPPASSAAPAPATVCPDVAVSMLGGRHWFTRNLALNAGAALVLGGGSQDNRLLDTYFGLGPTVGLSVLLGNWRHLAVAASPAVSFVWFKAAGAAASTYLFDLRAELEAELHFGFIGLPALSVGLRSGVLLRLEKSTQVTLWAAGVSGATTVRGLVNDLSLRYYF